MNYHNRTKQIISAFLPNRLSNRPFTVGAALARTGRCTRCGPGDSGTPPMLLAADSICCVQGADKAPVMARRQCVSCCVRRYTVSETAKVRQPRLPWESARAVWHTSSDTGGAQNKQSASTAVKACCRPHRWRQRLTSHAARSRRMLPGRRLSWNTIAKFVTNFHPPCLKEFRGCHPALHTGCERA